jgi:hypothetical protein
MERELPRMTREEEAVFWETHSSADYWDESEPVEIESGPQPRNTCPVCGRILLSRFVDVNISGGRAVLKRVRELYCPKEHEVRLAPETQRVVRAVEAVLNLAPGQATLIPVAT